MIDSTLYAVDLPVGTYTKGQKLPMVPIKGPAVVRDGYGTAVLKQVVTLATASYIEVGTYVEFKNSNWNDSQKNIVNSANGNQQFSLLARTSPCLQKCGDTELQPNSSFEVNLVIGQNVTTTAVNTVFLLVDIDYPSVQAVQNPADEKGQPVTIMREDAVTVTADGSALASVWTTINVDEFKAGYRYLLAQAGIVCGNAIVGFVAFSGAPSMNGLVRIIPSLPKTAANARLELDYSTPLLKGPMDISYALYGTAGASTAVLECDYIRR